MKRIVIFMILAASLFGNAQGGHPIAWQVRGEISTNVGFFYSSLSPYGEWIESDFGRAWRPHRVVHGWRPYLYGQWVWTDYGWYWVSAEPFGWATFHYGRWSYDNYYGWIWIPDNVWGPAWVEWRNDETYIGWAPLSPYATFSLSVGITFTNHWVAPVHYWNFVPCRYLTTTRIVEHVQPIERTRRFFGETRGSVNIIAQDDRIINRGLDVSFVERRSNTRINKVEVVQNNRGSGDRYIRESNRERVEIYRPHLDNQSRREGSPLPDLRRGNQPPGRHTEGSLDQREETNVRSRGRDPRKPDIEVQRRVEVPIPSQHERENIPDRQIQERQQREQLHEQQMRERERRQETVRVNKEQQRQQEQERRNHEQQTRDNAKKDRFRWEQQQPQVRERPQPAQRPAESRGGRERVRRP